MNTPYGEVDVKEVSGFGVRRTKIEAEDVMRIAKENNKSFEEVTLLINGIEINDKKE